MAMINHDSLGPHLWEHPYYEHMVPVVVTSMILLSLYVKLSSCVPWTGMVWVTAEKTLIICKKQTKNMLYQPAQNDFGHY